MQLEQSTRLCKPAAFTLPNALRAGGDVTFTMCVSVGSIVVFRIFFSSE